MNNSEGQAISKREALPFMVLKVESSDIHLILGSFYSTSQTSGSA